MTFSVQVCTIIADIYVHQMFLTATLKDEIEGRREEGMELFANKDINSLVSYFAPGATLMFPGSDNIQGTDGNN